MPKFATTASYSPSQKPILDSKDAKILKYLAKRAHVGSLTYMLDAVKLLILMNLSFSFFMEFGHAKVELVASKEVQWFHPD